MDGDGPSRGVSAPDGVVRAAAEREAKRADVWRALEAIPLDDEPAARFQAAATLRASLKAGRDRIEEAFFASRRSGLVTAQALSTLTDDIVRMAFRFASERLHPQLSPTTGERLALMATGGYGRGEMAPHSDVDLLFLTPYRKGAWVESVIEATLYILWDLKLKVGHAARSVDDCVRLAGGDVTIRTALLERRLLAGAGHLAEDLAEELSRRLWAELFSRTGPEFVSAKLAERDARHERTGGSRYLLEPNVKESKGGLRDLHTLHWLMKYLYRVDDVADLTERGVFTADEARRSGVAAAHLWTMRCALHFVAGRAQEKLSFDFQVELAERLGYRSVAGQRPVERMMKRYFLAAREVGDLTRIFCAALEAQHKKSPPLLGGVRQLFWSAPSPDEAWLEVRDGRLMIADVDALSDDPTNLLRFFRAALDKQILIHPQALRLISRRRRLADDLLPGNPEAQRLFLGLISGSNDATRALRRMSETGVLGRFVPAFRRVIGLMQFNMYHHFTVDEHSLLCVDAFAKLRAGELTEQHPIETELAVAIDDPRIMTVALLLHDVGKGLPGDHSVTGAGIVRQSGPDLGLSRAETDEVAWLVEHHLLMSDVAQRRDITDPATVRAFAEEVRSTERLKRLYVLTACDIRSVGPGVWTGWKAQLLRHLYTETRAYLTGDVGAASRDALAEEAKAALRAALPDWSEAAFDAHAARFFPTYWVGLGADTHAVHAEMMREADAAAAGGDGKPARENPAGENPAGENPAGENPAGDDPADDDPADPGAVRLTVTASGSRAAAKCAFYTADHPGLFARLSGALALAGETVVDARAYTTRDGMAVNTFWVADPEADGERRAARLEREVRRALAGEVIARDALQERRRTPQREKAFDVAPKVSFDNEASDLFTVVETSGRDRVGLLYDLARALAAESVNINSAIIATYGEHAVDVFYVRDVFGMKIRQPGKQARVRRALLDALEGGRAAR